MRHLLLLVAMVAAGQMPTYIPKSGQVITSKVCDDPRGGIYFCPVYGILNYDYRIDWLRPDLYIWPNTVTVLGSAAYAFGHEGFAHIYIQAPLRSVVILLPDGKRVTITRAEIDGRAK